MDIKLGANQIDAGAKNLLTIKKQFEADPQGKAAFSAVWSMRPTSGRMGYLWCR